MKLGIPLLIIGILLLVFSIPLAVIFIVGGVSQLTVGNVSGGFLSYTPLVTVVLGMVLTTIGATRVFKN